MLFLNPRLTAAQSVSNKIATSQIAMPKASCDLVYATSGYSSSVRNLSADLARVGQRIQQWRITGARDGDW